MEWLVIDSGKQLPEDIMNKDKALLNQMGQNPRPLLHFYTWEGSCLTYGYFIDPSKHLHMHAIESNKIKIARRPTGGGIVFHMTDFAFSILLPTLHPRCSLNSLENYAFINAIVAEAVSPLGEHKKGKLWCCENKKNQDPFCMAGPTQYDIVVEGKKMGGAAQRRTKTGLLHQGSISLAFPPEELLRQVLKNKNISTTMRGNSYVFLEDNWTNEQLSHLRQGVKQNIIERFLCIVD